MKTIKLQNNFTFYVAQSPKSEVSFLRYFFFLQHFGLISYNIDNIDFANVLKEYDNAVILDEKRLLLVNYLQAIEIKKQDKNAYIECFKAISFLENETNEVDELFWNTKMKVLNFNGLTFEIIEREVNFFYKSLISNNIEKTEVDNQAIKRILQNILNFRKIQFQYLLNADENSADNYGIMINKELKKLDNKEFSIFYDKKGNKLLSFFDYYRNLESEKNKILMTIKDIANERLEDIKKWTMEEINIYVEFYNAKIK